MLIISPAQMHAFEETAVQRLLRRIDAWLASVAPPWAALPDRTREPELADIGRHADACGMASEHDVALFAFACITLGPRWRELIAAPAIWSILTDPQWKPPQKLLHLEEALLPESAA